MEPTRVALVGAGAIAQAWLEAIRSSASALLAGVADPAPGVAEAAAEAFGAPAFGDVEQLLDTVRPDLLIVSSPPTTHADIAITALDQGISVLCEKPLAPSLAEAEKMLAAAAASGAVLTMASKFRFVDAVIRAKSMLTSGALGDVIWVRNTFTAPVDMTNRWNSDPDVSGGGVIIDNGTHSVDLCRYLAGPITAVQAVEGPRTQGLRVEDTAQLWGRTATGAVASINLSWSMSSALDAFVEVDGTEGQVSIGWKGSRLSSSSGAGWTDFSTGYDKTAAFERNLVDVIQAVRGDHPPLLGPDDLRASVAVIEAAYQSIATGSWVDVAVKVHPSAEVETGAAIGEGTAIWSHAHLRSGAVVGRDCIIGEKTYIAGETKIGDRVKINAMAYVCAGVTLEDGVMIAAGVVFTNDRYPRATTNDLSELLPSEVSEETLPTFVGRGATIGAGSVIGSGIEIGEFAMVGMGSVVTRSVPPHALVLGNPARVTAWVCRCGQPVQRLAVGVRPVESDLTCSRCGWRYHVTNEGLQLIGPPD